LHHTDTELGEFKRLMMTDLFRIADIYSDYNVPHKLVNLSTYLLNFYTY